jgi:glycosyltransferase involved in cell wall biosynthesis
MNKEIAILLPYKEQYTIDKAGAASIWVKDYLRHTNLKNNTIVYGNLNKNDKPISNNFKNILIDNIFLKKNLYYTKKFYEHCVNQKHKIIEIHNRPESLNFFFDLKAAQGFKLIFVFHNNPLELRGSRTVKERENIIKNTDQIFFVSDWVRRKFFSNISNKVRNNCDILYPAINPIKTLNKYKKNNIIFTGKLNSSKGYDIFLDSVIKILNKYNHWTATAVGNEPREKFKKSHERLKIIGWKKHNEILSLYNKSSISVVPSKWEEPFGRTAMESAAYGCATITSKNGGLTETFDNDLILPKNTSNEIFKLIDKLIKDKIFLRKIQLKNQKNVKHNIVNLVDKLDRIKSFLLLNNFNFFRKKQKKILHISNFDERNNHRLFNISIASKMTKGFIHNNHDVINFSYRNYLSAFNKDNTKKINDKIKNICNNYKPDLIILGHNNVLQGDTISVIKKNLNSKIILWYEDALAKSADGPSWESNLNLIEKKHDLIDCYFTTTHPRDISKTIINKKKINFLPMLVDENIENLHLFDIKNKFKDLFFAISHGVNFGKLKKNKIDERERFVNKLFLLGRKINFNILGIANENPKWNYDFYNELSKCKMALNLSRGKPIKYATSNRIASLVGNGIYTFIDEKTKYNDFFDETEMGFYKNEKDLINKVENLKGQDHKLYKYSMNGMKRYFELFNNKLVTKYILDRTFNTSEDKRQIWEKY